MSIEHNTIGTIERSTLAQKAVKTAEMKDRLESWVFTPGFWLLHSALFGACFGILSFLTVLGVRLALKF